MAHLKRRIDLFKAADGCLAHDLLIAISKVDNYSKYKSYCKCWKIPPPVQNVLETTGIELNNGSGFSDRTRYQKHFLEYKIVMYQWLSGYNIMFEGQVENSKRLNPLYDEVDMHYHVVTNLTGATAKHHVFKACNKGCTREVTQSVTRRVATAWRAGVRVRRW